MPIQESTHTPQRQALMIGLGVLVAIAAVIYLIQLLTPDESRSVQLEVAASEISLGSASEQSEAIREGGPILYPDLASGTRSFYLTVDPDNPLRFFAFSNLANTSSDTLCEVQWVRETQTFTDCNQKTYPLDGQGLKQFNVTVREDNIIVELNTLS